VDVVVRAAVAGNAGNFDEVIFTLDVVQEIWVESFETGAGSGWTFSGAWAWGTPGGYVGWNGTEPAGCHSGTGCIGTGMGVEYSDSMTYTTNRAISPFIDLGSAANPQLVFSGFVSTEAGWDGANVWICTNGGAICNVLPNPTIPYHTILGMQEAWEGQALESWNEISFDLSAYAGQVIQLAFALYSDGSGTYTGMYIDDVMILD
jgi:hypothetical protein